MKSARTLLAMKVVVYAEPHTRRSSQIGEALLNGARRMGWSADITPRLHIEAKGDIIAAYGWKNVQMFNAYRKAGRHFLYVDLGYWSRKRSRGDFSGFHKCVLDARHATKYFQRNRPADRIKGAPSIEPWQSSGKHIILAGMSAKGAGASGQPTLAWELATIAKLRKVTDRPIIYRPKPSWRDAKPIDGTTFSPGTQPIAEVLRGAHALVTYHSNASLDALAAGVPIYAHEGLGSVMSMGSLADIETPPRPAGRKQLFADIGYCQWSVAEITDGTMWAQFVADGMLR